MRLDTIKKHWIAILGTLILAGFFSVSLVGTWVVYTIAKDLPNPERITERSIAETTKIYDRTGEVLLYEIHGEEKRTVVSLSDIPQAAIDATLAAEDIHFYKHAGLDWRGILRAAFVNLLSGDISQGGSTITQQLVKKALLSDERTYTRKIKEAILSILIERKYSKDEILEWYFNQIPYGSNAYGIAAASELYFGKDIRTLSLAEAAILASLTRAPTYYSPYGTHQDELFARRDWVLDRMVEAGFIPSADAEAAKTKELVFVPMKQTIRAPHFVMYVRDYLNEKYGEEYVERGGLRIITTVDWKLQEAAERAVREGTLRNEKLVRAKNAALVAIDPKTGDILSMVGSHDYFDLENDGNVNVTIRPRQPGSAFKPFVYATAFKKGYTPETVLMDVFTEFNPLCNPDGTPGPLISDPKSCYHPKNYDDTFRGPVSLRQSIAQSLNVPSVKLLYLAGVNDSIETARAMGITTLTDPQRYGLSLVLGGAEVKLLEMTSAFGAFAREGVLSPPRSILMVQAPDKTILEEAKTMSIPVIDTEVARTINSVLSDNDARVPVFSPSSSLYFPGRKVAAKTGTTQDYRDAWTIGYTPSIVAGVWVGNNDNAPMQQEGLSVMVAGPIWHQFLDAVFASQPPEEFISPTKRIIEKPALSGSYRDGPLIKIDSISKKLATEFTPPELIEEVSFGAVRSILSFIDKNDPAGPQPNPITDPQYPNWQQGIDLWLASHFLATGTPPTDFDDIHAPDKQPRLFLLFPAPAIPAENVSTIMIQANSIYPLKEISFSVNGEFLLSKTAPILDRLFTVPFDAPLPPGTHTIQATAYDIMGNRSILEETITVLK